MICKKITYITNISDTPKANLGLAVSADVLVTHVVLVQIGTAPAPHFCSTRKESRAELCLLGVDRSRVPYIHTSLFLTVAWPFSYAQESSII